MYLKATSNEIWVPHPNTLKLAVVVSIAKLALRCCCSRRPELPPFLMLDAQVIRCLRLFRVLVLVGGDVACDEAESERRHWVLL